MITKYLIEEQTLTDIADSIREMDGSDDAILVEDYADRIKDIEPSMHEYLFIAHQIEPYYLRRSTDEYGEVESKRTLDLYNKLIKIEGDI